MRKLLFSLLLLLALMVSCASAETFTFDSIYATCTISDDYIILTPDNLDRHPEWVAKIAADETALLEDYEARGVLLQAWTQSGDACLEITAVQDELGKRLFDIDAQITQTRTNYRVQHAKGQIYADEGHVYSSAEWKKTNQYGRFLLLKYTCENEDNPHKGYARRTIRNGYTITLDYKVFGRSLKSADEKAVNNVLGTWKFTTTLPKPDECVPKLVFTSEPLQETYSGEFTVKGTGDPGLTIISVLMRMANPDEPIILEETVNKSGEFSIDVDLPEEGIWNMTMTVLNKDVITEEVFFDSTTNFDKDQIPINLDEPIPDVLPEDTFTVSGMTMRQTKVQCIVDGVYDKQLTTNNTGRFSFKVPTNKDGKYTFTLVFEKKNYDTRRVEYIATRTLTEADIREDIREIAVKPAYSTLTDKITGYTGRTMGYTLYVMSVEPSGDEWITFMAMRKVSSGYRDIVVVMSREEPILTEGTQVKMYGTCTGQYEVIDENDKTKKYPSFDLLFWDN